MFIISWTIDIRMNIQIWLLDRRYKSEWYNILVGHYTWYSCMSMQSMNLIWLSMWSGGVLRHTTLPSLKLLWFNTSWTIDIRMNIQIWLLYRRYKSGWYIFGLATILLIAACACKVWTLFGLVCEWALDTSFC